MYEDTAITLQLEATANGALAAQAGPFKVVFEAELTLGKTLDQIAEPAQFRLGVNRTMLSTDSTSIGAFAKDVFKSIEWGLTAAAVLKVTTQQGSVRDIIDDQLDILVDIPNIWKFLTAKQKSTAIVLRKKPYFCAPCMMARLLDPRMLVRQLDKGLKFLHKLLVGSGSVAKKIPIKWLKARLVKVLSGGASFVNAFRKKVVGFLNELLTQIEDEGLQNLVQDKLQQLFGGVLKLLQQCQTNAECALNPRQYAHCLQNDNINYVFRDKNVFDDSPVCLAKVTGNMDPNVSGLIPALLKGVEWTIPIGMRKSFRLPDVDFGFGGCQRAAQPCARSAAAIIICVRRACMREPACGGVPCRASGAIRIYVRKKACQ